MKKITSSDNEIYKSFARLYKRKHRDREGLYVIEGINLIEEAVKNGAELKSVFVRDDFDISALERITGGRKNDVPVYMLSRALFDKTADTETPQGIAAVSEKPECSEQRFFDETDDVIVLDRLQDPGNIGTVIRTAAAGSLYRVRLLFAESPADAAEKLRTHGRQIICTSPYAEKLFYDADMAHKTALVIGNEANGVCEELQNAADVNVKLPMEGTIESLNAAVAAAVVMYEAVRQRHMR